MKWAVRLLFGVGMAGLIYGVAFAHATMLAPEQYELLGDDRLWWWSVFLLGTVVTSYALGLPEVPPTRWSAGWRGMLTVAASTGIIALAQTAVATSLLPRSALLIVSAAFPVWTVLAWNLALDSGQWAAAKDRIFLVLSNEEDLEQVKRDLESEPERPATVVGWVDLVDVASDRSGVLSRLGSEAQCSVLVLDAAAQSSDQVIIEAAALHEKGVRIRSLALFYEEWIGKLPHRELARISLLFDIGELHRAQYMRVKRVVDIVFGLIGCIALVPIGIMIFLLNPVFNRGPLFYSQPRVGHGGREFTIYKLRTMMPDVGSSEWTVPEDTRITPLGALLRKSHLDELPQALNILRGDLALVGPRPEQPRYVSDLGEKIPFYDVRHLVRPGLTGWAQVKQGYTSDDHDAFEKLQYDFYYLRRQGLALDSRIIWRTLRGVVSGDGR